VATMSKFFEVRIIVQVDDEYSESVRAPGRDKTMPVNWEDVEWAIRDLFDDDEEDKPNFNIGSVNSIIAEEFERTG